MRNSEIQRYKDKLNVIATNQYFDNHVKFVQLFRINVSGANKKGYFSKCLIY